MGMGGEKSENYLKFKKKCVSAYLYLRKYGKLIVYLFHLMIDSGIKDISFEALEKLEDKFRLEESDTQAEAHFLNILEESINTFFGVFHDEMHKIMAQYFR